MSLDPKRKYIDFYLPVMVKHNETFDRKLYSLKDSIYLTLDDRPDLKERAEKAWNNKQVIGIYERGSRNGYDFIDGFITDIDNPFNPNFGELYSILNITTKEKLKKKELTLPEKPNEFYINNTKWDILARNIQRQKNTLLIGATGTGKTQLAFHLAKSLGLEPFYINLGSSDDFRGLLIGETHYDPKIGTYFRPSSFIKEIEKPNRLIILDEISRAHPGIWNLLMPLLDINIRNLRVDEEDRKVEVHPTTSFIATANIGVDYTSTRTMDRAVMDRFLLIQMDDLTRDQEFSFLKSKCSDINENDLNVIVNISKDIKKSYKEGDLSNFISLRYLLEITELVEDGFSLEDSINIIVNSLFNTDDETEQTFIKQIFQKYINYNVDINVFFSN